MQTLKWFKSKIGKRIYRDTSGCHCESCTRVETEGIIVMDEVHADYLFHNQNDFADEGLYLNYTDKKKGEYDV